MKVSVTLTPLFQASFYSSVTPAWFAHFYWKTKSLLLFDVFSKNWQFIKPNFHVMQTNWLKSKSLRAKVFLLPFSSVLLHWLTFSFCLFWKRELASVFVFFTASYKWSVSWGCWQRHQVQSWRFLLFLSEYLSFLSHLSKTHNALFGLGFSVYSSK